MITNPVAAAERVLDELQITDHKDLRSLDLIAWERGALVRETEMSGAEARITRVKNRAIITLSTAIVDLGRKRFGLAHEIGHLEMHGNSDSLQACLSEDIDEHPHTDQSGKKLEVDANIFASALLLPERFFAPLCITEEPSFELIRNLANEFEVSLTATSLRLTQFCQEPIAIVFSQDKRIKWFRGSSFFSELGLFVPVKEFLQSGTLAKRFFDGQPMPASPRRIKAEKWLSQGRYKSDATITEQSLAMPGFDAVLTLLWIDDVIEDDDTIW